MMEKEILLAREADDLWGERQGLVHLIADNDTLGPVTGFNEGFQVFIAGIQKKTPASLGDWGEFSSG